MFVKLPNNTHFNVSQISGSEGKKNNPQTLKPKWCALDCSIIVLYKINMLQTVLTVHTQ